jgi:vacuolar protein sorting-associated protein 13A/C
MFESILEKILQSYLGKFLIDFDRKNLSLGVWKGDVIIKNVKVNPEIIDMLHLPIRILFSNIGTQIKISKLTHCLIFNKIKSGNLRLLVPWSKLSSIPIKIELSDIFIILGPVHQKDWNYNDRMAIKKKLEVLLNYANGVIKKFDS